MAGMRVLRGKAVGNTVVLEETLPEGAAVDVLVHEGDAMTWRLTEEGWALLEEARESIRQGRFVTDEELQAELDAIDAE
jgi:hypothetical protein